MLRGARRLSPRPGRGRLSPSSSVPSGIAIAGSQPSAPVASRVAVAVATVGGVGFVPLAPGTLGAAVALPVFVLSSLLVSPESVALTASAAASVPSAAAPPELLRLLRLLRLLGVGLLALVLFVLGVWAAGGAERAFGRKDDGRIVIDELVGQLVALAPLALTASPAGPLGLVTAFVAFRGFDIWKPGPVRWAERAFRGGFGVMMDDVVAGLLGAALVGVLLSLGVLA